jgi:hypothetical protein
MVRSRRLEMGGAYGTNLGERNMFEVLMRIREGLRTHGRPRHRWEDNINPLQSD